jgi:hypothetical protein
VKNNPILKEHPIENSEGIESSEFSLNTSFSTPLALVKVFTSDLDERKGESMDDSKVDTVKKVIDGRKFVLQSIMAKAIKTHKKLTHAELFKLTAEKSQFPCEKERFDATVKILIELDIMEENPEEKNTYIYPPPKPYNFSKPTPPNHQKSIPFPNIYK